MQSPTFLGKGLLTYLLSLPQDWIFTLKHFIQTSKNGQASIRAILKELRQAGYLELKKIRDEKGIYRTTSFSVEEIFGWCSGVIQLG